jgi:hypothetical protein
MKLNFIAVFFSSYFCYTRACGIDVRYTMIILYNTNITWYIELYSFLVQKATYDPHFKYTPQRQHMTHIPNTHLKWPTFPIHISNATNDPHSQCISQRQHITNIPNTHPNGIKTTHIFSMHIQHKWFVKLTDRRFHLK